MPAPTGASSMCFFLFLFLFLLFCNSVESSAIPNAKDTSDFEKREVEREREQVFPSIHRVLINYFRYDRRTEFDSIDPPTTTLPTGPVTNPVTAPAVTVPPDNSAPLIVTVPGTNPIGVSSPNPPVVPVTNPVTTPSTYPGGQPTTNPVTTIPPPTAAGGNAPAGAGQGQSWCVAKNGALQAALQSALDYACGIGGADCSMIQQGASCYNPITLQNHASYAFSSYYQKNPVPTSCDFGGVAIVTNVNPSMGSCVFPSSSSSPTTPTTPTTQTPGIPTPLPTPTTSSSGSNVPGTSPPPGFSLGNPGPGTGLGGFGASPPPTDTASVSNNLQPFIGSLLLVTSITMGRLMFGV